MSQEILEKLVSTITAYYRENDKPLLLSRFGQLQPELLAEVKGAFPSLAAAIREAGEERLRIVRPVGAKGQEVVAPAARSADIEKSLSNSSAALQIHAAEFDSLPIPVQLAFCLQNRAGEVVAIRTSPPFRYGRFASLDLLRPGYVVIPESFRRAGLPLKSATAQDKEGLWQSFLAWAREMRVDVAAFAQKDRPNALARLLAAQDPAILERLVIPADIAALLLKRD